MQRLSTTGITHSYPLRVFVFVSERGYPWQPVVSVSAEDPIPYICDHLKLAAGYLDLDLLLGFFQHPKSNCGLCVVLSCCKEVNTGWAEQLRFHQMVPGKRLKTFCRECQSGRPTSLRVMVGGAELAKRAAES